MRLRVVLEDAGDVRLDPGLLAGPLEVHELEKAGAQDYDADGGEHEQRPVEGSQLVVGGGAQVRSVEWICRRVVKDEGGVITCHNARGAANGSASTSTSRKGWSIGAPVRTRPRRSRPGRSTRSGRDTARRWKPAAPRSA